MKSEKYLSTGNNEEIEIDIARIFKSIVSKLWLVILVGLIGALGAYYYTSEMVTPTYNSTARVYIQNSQTIQSSASDLQSATTLKEDFLVMVRSDEVYRQVLESMGENGADYKSLRGKISLDNNNTRFVDITVNDPDPVRAKRLADATAYVSRIKAKEILGVQDVAIMQLGSVSTTPASPNMTKNIILGAGAGMFLVCAIIAVCAFFNNKITTVEDIEKYLEITVLGSIPDIKTIPGYAKKMKFAEEDEIKPKKNKKDAGEDKSPVEKEKKKKEKKDKKSKSKKKVEDAAQSDIVPEAETAQETVNQEDGQ